MWILDKLRNLKRKPLSKDKSFVPRKKDKWRYAADGITKIKVED